MLLSNNKNLFIALIENASRYLKVSDVYVEKDFYAISILKELVSRDTNFVFKGGTSLSVCQKVINRFSEDIDISYSEERITVGNKKRIKQVFFDSIEATSLSVSNIDNIRSRRVFNRYICPYKSKLNQNEDVVLVEWAIITPSFPIEEKVAQTIIGKYLTSIGRLDLVEEYGLEPFLVKTITKGRTLVDKVFAICDYHLNGKLERQSRHIYDIKQLLDCVELDNDFIDLFNKVMDYRKELDSCVSTRDGRPISSILMEIIEKNTYKSDYNSRTFPLLYDHVKYEDCLPAIKRISAFLKENNR